MIFMRISQKHPKINKSIANRNKALIFIEILKYF